MIVETGTEAEQFPEKEMGFSLQCGAWSVHEKGVGNDGC